MVVIALYAFWFLNIEQLWIEFGQGKDQRWYPIHKYAMALGEEICMGIPFWYAFSGCDTVSQFGGRGKKTAWNTWRKLGNCTETFARLSSISDILDNDLKTIEMFVVSMYDMSCPVWTVNECRKYLFCKKGKSIDNCPPSLDALVQHIKRAMVQSHVWTNFMSLNEPKFDEETWGFSKDENGLLNPIWTKLPKASNACKELKHCGCKKNCATNGKCQCKEYSLPCNELCSCGGYCI